MEAFEYAIKKDVRNNPIVRIASSSAGRPRAAASCARWQSRAASDGDNFSRDSSRNTRAISLSTSDSANSGYSFMKARSFSGPTP